MLGKYPGIVFAKVDVDEVEEVEELPAADQHGVSAMPTFHSWPGMVRIWAVSQDMRKMRLVKRSKST